MSNVNASTNHQRQSQQQQQHGMLHIFSFSLLFFTTHAGIIGWMKRKKVKKNLQGMTPMDYALHLKHTGLFFFFLFLFFLFPSPSSSLVFFASLFSLSNTCSLNSHLCVLKFILVPCFVWTIEVTLAMVLHPTRFVVYPVDKYRTNIY